jgi:hypothetical protein
MSIDLSNYTSVGTALIAAITVENYKQNAGDPYTSTVLRFSDYNYPLVIDGNTYLGLGKFVGITPTTSELKSSTGQITVTISGIPNTAISEIINSRIKGSPIEVYRVIFDSQTRQVLSIEGNPAGRFFGYVSNYTLDEEYDIQTRTASNTIAMICASTQEFLENKVTGRKTNPTSQKSFYPGDASMNRVPSLVGASFNFGVPK